MQQDIHGMTPLMDAALSSARETARFLLAAGASTNVLSYGCPALFSALQSGDTVISEWLAESTTAGEAGFSL